MENAYEVLGLTQGSQSTDADIKKVAGHSPPPPPFVQQAVAKWSPLVMHVHRTRLRELDV